MTAAERREEIKSVMLFRREDKIENLAFEFGVTEKTIRRDITILQCEGLPIDTRRGRYNGGVYIESWYRGDMPCFKENEEAVLREALQILEENISTLQINEDKLHLLRSTIDKYSCQKEK